MSQLNISNVAGRRAAESAYPEREQIQTHTAEAAMLTTSKIGWWSAVIAGLCSVGYGIASIAVLVSSFSIPAGSPAQGWTGIDAFLETFQPVQMLPVIPSLFLAPAFTVLMACIHSYAAEEKKTWSLIGLAFTLIYATMAATNYMTQLLPVWRSINQGETDGLAMFVLGNPHSIFWGLAYAYIFMNLAMLFCAPVFTGTRLKNRLRMLFILNGISGVFTLASAFLDSPPIYLLGSLVFWCPVFTAAMVLAAVLFRQTEQRRS